MSKDNSEIMNGAKTVSKPPCAFHIKYQLFSR